LDPGIYDEFLKCTSVFVISDKEDSEQISSDGEFMDANRVDIYNEDDSFINVIEERNERKKLICYDDKYKPMLGKLNTPNFKQGFPHHNKPLTCSKAITLSTKDLDSA